MDLPASVLMIGTLIPVLAVLFGGLLLLVPVVGLTARLALKPMVEAIASARASAAAEVAGKELLLRIEALERTVEEEPRPRLRLGSGGSASEASGPNRATS